MTKNRARILAMLVVLLCSAAVLATSASVWNGSPAAVEGEIQTSLVVSQGNLGLPGGATILSAACDQEECDRWCQSRGFPGGICTDGGCFCPID